MIGSESDRWPKPAHNSLEGHPPGWSHTPPILESARTFYDEPTFVGLNDASVIYQKPDTSAAIVTANLWVCTATVVQFESPARRALSHYDPDVTTFSEDGLGDEFIEQLTLLA